MAAILETIREMGRTRSLILCDCGNEQWFFHWATNTLCNNCGTSLCVVHRNCLREESP